jgi:hypothetical protein
VITSSVFTGFSIVSASDSQIARDGVVALVLLALGGFVGNLGLSLLDHAQDGFFRWTEWIPVVAATGGVNGRSVRVRRARVRAAALRRSRGPRRYRALGELDGAATHTSILIGVGSSYRLRAGGAEESLAGFAFWV